MPRITRSSAKPQRSDKPSRPTPVDLEIARHKGTSAALEATPDRLQASKRAPVPSPAERIQELTRENGQLRVEIRCHHQKQDAIKVLKGRFNFAFGELEQSVAEFYEVEREIEDERDQATRH